MAQNLPGGLIRPILQSELKKTWGSEKVGNSLFSESHSIFQVFYKKSKILNQSSL